MSLIQIPLAYSDSGHVAAFVKALRAFPPAKDDYALIVPTPQITESEPFKSAIADLVEIFTRERTFIKELPNVPEGGWPAASNKHHMWMMIYAQEVERTIGQIPSLRLEADCTPIRRGWSEEIATEYRHCGKLFLGVEVPSIVVLTNNVTKVQTVENRGVHMMGNAMYPPNYIKGRSGWKFPQPDISFTIFCQHEHIDFYRSSLIEHRPRTINWKVNSDGSFSCEDAPGKTEHHIKYAGTFDLPKAVLVHGCKDGSLIEVIAQIDRVVGGIRKDYVEEVWEARKQEEYDKLCSTKSELQSLQERKPSQYFNPEGVKVLEEKMGISMDALEILNLKDENAILKARIAELETYIDVGGFRARMGKLASQVGAFDADVVMCENRALRGRVEELEAERADFAPSSLRPPPLESVVQSTEPAATGGILPSKQAVEDALKDGKMRLKEMAEHFSVTDLVRLEVHLNSLGYEAPKPFRWVSEIKKKTAIKKVKKPKAA